MSCHELIKRIDNLSCIAEQQYGCLKQLVTPESKIYYSNDAGWTNTQIGNIYEYQKKTTLIGAAQNIDLTIPFSFELNRIEYFSDDTTAKSFTERIFSGNVDLTSYDQIVNVALNVDQAIAYYPTGAEGIYTQLPIRIRTAISASTINKSLTKKIVVRKL